jgi:dTDP-4-amino-4,6-dideoxygalactose transaminase
MSEHDPYDVVRRFEAALCDYTGARYAVATTSCTTALLLALAWHSYAYNTTHVTVPRFTYVGVPQSAWNAGMTVGFEDRPWRGDYRVGGTAVVDSARRFTSGMFYPGEFRCVSFHWAKHIGIGQGGAVLHDSDDADPWLRRARFDGRAEGADPKTDRIQTPAWHATMMPRDAAEGLTLLANLPRHNDDLPNSDYPDLTEVFV